MTSIFSVSAAPACRRRSKSTSAVRRRPSTHHNETLNAVLATTGVLIADHRIRDPLESALGSTTCPDRVLTLVGNEAALDPPLWLCGPCQALMQTPPPAFNLQGHLLEEWGSLPAEYWNLHHNNLFQLIDCCFGRTDDTGWSRTCQLCQLIWRGLCRQLSPRRPKKHEGAGHSFPGGEGLQGWLTAEPHLDCHQGLRVSRFVKGNDCRLAFNIPLPPRDISLFGIWLPWDMALLESWVWFMLPVAYKQYPLGEQRLLSDSTSSEQAFDYIRDRIRTCRETHPLCRAEPATAEDYPTRLIRVGANGKAVYLEDRDIYAGGEADRQAQSGQPSLPSLPPYIALSYRWGSVDDTLPTKQRLMLTETTGERLRSGLAITDLPQVIRDACTTATRLGYQHIWVDRLCIFQDSANDWNREAAHMAQIYKQAALVLSASCAADEDATFFRHRGSGGGGIRPLLLRSTALLPEEHIEKRELLASTCAASEQRFYIVIESERPHDDDPSHGKLGHLAARGWIYQERTLAQRIVHFSGEEVHWECRQLEDNETGTYRVTEKWLKRPQVSRDPRAYAMNSHRSWCQVVENYSRRELTFERDRLLAVAGLAKETQSVLRRDVADEAYYAGLWKSTFIAGLCWQDMHRGLRKSRTYVAPSWSWASYEIRATWSYTASDGADAYRLAELTEVRLKHLGSDPFGAVQDGYMVLYGHFIPVQIGGGWLNDKFWGGEPKLATWGPKQERLDFQTTYNGLLEVESLRASVEDGYISVVLLPLCKKDTDKGEYTCWCLLLAPHGAIEYDRRPGEALDAPIAATPPDGNEVLEYDRIGYVEMQVEDTAAWWAWLAENPKRDVVVR
ncbi:heterokaryon incompatibility protein-domain-containing protein [Microdochium trichocladiopsis]|uniref:Heterokaryon incompatibility protein-domain-containing protein n=1 Tax=Microdochium trichocladiopsis TaxID=1682393 RepID=A0A9P9BXE2_9PEZI|nr:heterokaryon incompatibility protein-domain-containing protein [Microdochium trichocladiopsis]KAH7035986.1 heterokaryon incompatibility protein-domain-containing protein [Microdochium trichocladiopsis]